MSCLLNVVAYLGKREKALTPEVSIRSYVKMLGVIWVKTLKLCGLGEHCMTIFIDLCN